MGRDPGDELIGVYARAVGRTNDCDPLALPAIAIRYPPFLRPFDPLGRRSPGLSGRLRLALMIVEASRAGKAKLFVDRKRAKVFVVLRLLALLVSESLLLVPRLLIQTGSAPEPLHGDRVPSPSSDRAR